MIGKAGKKEKSLMRKISFDEIPTEVYCQIVEHQYNVAYQD